MEEWIQYLQHHPLDLTRKPRSLCPTGHHLSLGLGLRLSRLSAGGTAEFRETASRMKYSWIWKDMFHGPWMGEHDYSFRAQETQASCSKHLTPRACKP